MTRGRHAAETNPDDLLTGSIHLPHGERDRRRQQRLEQHLAELEAWRYFNLTYGDINLLIDEINTLYWRLGYDREIAKEVGPIPTGTGVPTTTIPILLPTVAGGRRRT